METEDFINKSGEEIAGIIGERMVALRASCKCPPRLIVLGLYVHQTFLHYMYKKGMNGKEWQLAEILCDHDSNDRIDVFGSK